MALNVKTHIMTVCWTELWSNLTVYTSTHLERLLQAVVIFGAVYLEQRVRQQVGPSPHTQHQEGAQGATHKRLKQGEAGGNTVL